MLGKGATGVTLCVSLIQWPRVFLSVIWNQQHLLSHIGSRPGLSLVSIAAVSLKFWGLGKPHLLIYRDVLFVCVKYHIWYSFMGNWDVARRCNPCSCCWSIWCTQEYYSVPVETLPSHGCGAQGVAFQTAACNIIVTKVSTLWICT